MAKNAIAEEREPHPESYHPIANYVADMFPIAQRSVRNILQVSTTVMGQPIHRIAIVAGKKSARWSDLEDWRCRVLKDFDAQSE